MKFREEKDSIGIVKVPSDKLYGAQTARSLQNFRIGDETFSFEFIKTLILIKKSAAIANFKLGLINKKKCDLILKACEQLMGGDCGGLNFPLSIWQTGSGTQTNMNVNEVISNLAIKITDGKLGSKDPIHPNDDVNKGQSSNDVFPTAMNISTVSETLNQLLPALFKLQRTLEQKAKNFKKIIKIGRTHLMDATPTTLGNEFEAFADQIKDSIIRIKLNLKELQTLAIGGTAVGTGLNTSKKFAGHVVKILSHETKIEFKESRNKLKKIACHDDLIQFSGTLKTLAVSLIKIANDIRFLASGPRCGIGEINLPTNEPGSSIMPGKVNPTQCESILMVATQVIGLDTAVTIAGTNGNFELNVSKPLIIFNILKSINLLTDSINSFNNNCIDGITPNLERIKFNLENSLMLVTALNNKIGYDKSCKIAQLAFKDSITLKQAALNLGFLTEPEFEKHVKPSAMINPF